MTVTVANSGVTATHGQILAVYVLDGANSIQAKAAAGMAHSATATTAWTGSISTTVPGSWVMLAGAGSKEGTITANSSTVTLENEQDATDAVSLLTARQAFPTATTGNITLGWTSSASGDYALSLLEVLPVIVPLPPFLQGLALQAVKRASLY